VCCACSPGLPQHGMKGACPTVVVCYTPAYSVSHIRHTAGHLRPLPRSTGETAAPFSAVHCSAVQCTLYQCSAVQRWAVEQGWTYFDNSAGLVVWPSLGPSAVQCSAVQCSAVQCSAVQPSLGPRHLLPSSHAERSGRAIALSPVQCSAVQCSAVQCSAVQCSAVQCSAVQCIVPSLLRQTGHFREQPIVFSRRGWYWGWSWCHSAIVP
jgi:hypothetical protein